MAPLAQTLALLAMAVATMAFTVVPLNMANNSFDDQYLTCSKDISEKLLELQVPDFCNNDKFFENWKNATAQQKKRGPNPSPLTQDEAIALMVYTMNETGLYSDFNRAVETAGRSSWQYQWKFHFKSLHFLLTRAIQKLKIQQSGCKKVFRGVGKYQYKVEKDDEVRFGQFASASLSKTVAQGFGKATIFKVNTCHGADIQKFSMHPEQQEVLIPPFETFKVIAVNKENNTMLIELHSTRKSSNYDCEWLKGGSVSRNSPHLRGLLLATVAMAVVTGTL